MLFRSAGVENWRTRRTWTHESGAVLQVRSLTVDASDGTHSKTIYAYTGPRLYEGVRAIKGSSNPGAPLLPLKYTKVKGGRLFICGVNGGMDRLYRRLQMPEPGPGFIHLNEYATETWLTQLLSMRRVLDPKSGRRMGEEPKHPERATGRDELRVPRLPARAGANRGTRG